MNLAANIYNPARVYNLIILNPSTGMTLVNNLSSISKHTLDEFMDLACKAVLNGYQAKVWDLQEWDPLYSA